MRACEFIAEHKMAAYYFGCWPDFHDGEVMRVLLERRRMEGTDRDVSCLEIDIHGSIMEPEMTGLVFMQCITMTVVCFHLEDIFDFEPKVSTSRTFRLP